MRIKTGVVRRRAHKKLLAATKGYRMTKNRLVKVAKEALLHAGAYAYNGRKERKQQIRRLWISRISNSLGEHGVNYSQLIHQMKVKNIELDRKMLAEIQQKDPAAYEAVIKQIIS